MKTYDDWSNISSYSMSSINASITRNNSWNILQTFVNCQSLLRQSRAIHQLIKCLNGWEQSLKFHLTDYSNAFNAKLCIFLKEILWRVSPLSNIFGCIRSGQFSNKDHLNPRRTVMCYPRKSGFLYALYVLFNQIIMIIIQLWQHYTKIKMRRTDSVVSAEKSWGQAWTLYALVATRSLSPPVVASFLSTELLFRN